MSSLLHVRTGSIVAAHTATPCIVVVDSMGGFETIDAVELIPAVSAGLGRTAPPMVAARGADPELRSVR